MSALKKVGKPEKDSSNKVTVKGNMRGKVLSFFNKFKSVGTGFRKVVVGSSPKYIPKNISLIKHEHESYLNERSRSIFGKFVDFLFGKFDPLKERNAVVSFLRFVTFPIPKSLKNIIYGLSAVAVGYYIRSINLFKFSNRPIAIAQKYSDYIQNLWANISSHIHTLGFERTIALGVSTLAIGYWSTKMFGYIKRRLILKKMLNDRRLRTLDNMSKVRSIIEDDKGTIDKLKSHPKDNENTIADYIEIIKTREDEIKNLQKELDEVNRELLQYDKVRIFESLRYGVKKLAWAGGFASLSSITLQSAQPFFSNGSSPYSSFSFFTNMISFEHITQFAIMAGIPLAVHISMNLYAEYIRSKKDKSNEGYIL